MGFAEAALIMLVVLALATTIVVSARSGRREGEPESMHGARRASGRRILVSVGAASGVLAVAAVVHVLAPSLEAVPFVIGPLAAASAGIVAFALMPSPTIDGEVELRGTGLRRRELADYLSWGQRTAFIVTAAITACVALAGGVLSKSATDGRPLCTRLFPADCVAGGPTLFPGWLFAAPVLALVLTLLVVTRLAFRRIVDAPAPAWAEFDLDDDELRRRGARIVLRIGSTAMGLTTALLLGIAAFPLINARLLDTGLTTDGATTATLAGMVAIGASGVAFVYSVIMAIMVVVASRNIHPRANAGVETVAP